MSVKRSSGVTLLELLVTIAVAGIIATIAVPGIHSIIQNNRSVSYTNDFVTTLNFARSEAIKRRQTVTVCTSTDGANCRTDADKDHWEDGWIVTDASGTPLRISAGFATGELTGSTSIAYNETGASSINVFEMRIAECTGNHNRDINIGVTGRVSVEEVAC
jgi:type IV fimbrial biogenesis protein FimT